MTTTNPTSVVEDILDRVLPVLGAHLGEGERLRRLPDATAEALLSSGAFLAWVPRELGGHELPPAEFARMVEAISRVDSGAGFIVGNCNTNAYMMVALPEEGVREIFADRRSVVVGGGFPPAQAVPVPGGYRITGQAGFASGAHLASWVFAFAMIVENGAPRIGPDGMPSMLIGVMRRSECELLDTWHTLGLRSSGSHDFKYTNVFVPSSRTAPLAPLVNPNPLFRGPVYRARLWAGHPAFAVTGLGVARAALDIAFELAQHKTPNFMMQKLGDSPSVQRLLGRAEARWRAARAYIYETVDKLWKHQLTGEFVTHEHAIDMQLASSFAIEAAREVTELVHEIAGSTGFRENSPLERLFRDAHTMSQHAFTSAARFESAAKAMLGRDNDWAFFRL
ncbi:MAG TPA: acyl-CoA dehydrogenase family protein [Kofleriaceae bacterium]